MKVRKAVISVAGLRTRFLPDTKAIFQEMFTIVDLGKECKAHHKEVITSL